MSTLTDVETELRKMQKALEIAGVASGARVCELAAEIVRESGAQSVTLRKLANRWRREYRGPCAASCWHQEQLQAKHEAAKKCADELGAATEQSKQ